eukprot:1176720-Prorocentrum_minimum.AAC.1
MKGLLSLQQTATLLSVFADDRPFEETGQLFSRTFKGADKFTACCALTVLIQDPIMLKPYQRLATLYVLYDVYKGEPVASNPFLALLVEVPFLLPEYGTMYSRRGNSRFGTYLAFAVFVFIPRLYDATPCECGMCTDDCVYPGSPLSGCRKPKTRSGRAPSSGATCALRARWHRWKFIQRVLNLAKIVQTLYWINPRIKTVCARKGEWLPRISALEFRQTIDPAAIKSLPSKENLQRTFNLDRCDTYAAVVCRVSSAQVSTWIVYLCVSPPNPSVDITRVRTVTTDDAFLLRSEPLPLLAHNLFTLPNPSWFQAPASCLCRPNARPGTSCFKQAAVLPVLPDPDPYSIDDQRYEHPAICCQNTGANVDVKGNSVDVKGNSVDVKGNSVDVKGSSVDVKGNSVDVKGNSVDVKGSSVDVKGNSVDVKGSSVDVKNMHFALNVPKCLLRTACPRLITSDSLHPSSQHPFSCQAPPNLALPMDTLGQLTRTGNSLLHWLSLALCLPSELASRDSDSSGSNTCTVGGQRREKRGHIPDARANSVRGRPSASPFAPYNWGGIGGLLSPPALWRSKKRCGWHPLDAC